MVVAGSAGALLVWAEAAAGVVAGIAVEFGDSINAPTDCFNVCSVMATAAAETAATPTGSAEISATGVAETGTETGTTSKISGAGCVAGTEFTTGGGAGLAIGSAAAATAGWLDGGAVGVTGGVAISVAVVAGSGPRTTRIAGSSACAELAAVVGAGFFREERIRMASAMANSSNPPMTATTTRQSLKVSMNVGEVVVGEVVAGGAIPAGDCWEVDADPG